MSWWEALVLGIIQGLTEFFPVSSSGHLVLTQYLLGIELPGISFDVVVHVATLISVLVAYWERVTELVRGLLPGGKESSWPYLFKLVVATIPAAVVGLLFKEWFEARFDDPVFAGTMLLVTGSFVWSSRWARDEDLSPIWLAVPVVVVAVISAFAGTWAPFLAVLGLEALVMGIARLTARPEGVEEPRWSGAILIGIAQAIAILPGISRSGSTVVTGLWSKIDPVRAAEFSFFMAIPAILGAALLDAPDAMREISQVGAIPLVIGFIAAAVSGILAIRFFVALLRRQNFYAFAWYAWAVGGLFILLFEA